MPVEAIEADAQLDRDSPLSAVNVENVFTACLAENPNAHNAVTVEGIMHTASFDRAKLADSHGRIAGMLDQLPSEFKAHDRGGGGGWSFLNACMDRDNNQWTGLHLTMEKLFLLGFATDQAQWCLPREMWDALPGSMPYVVVTPKLP